MKLKLKNLFVLITIFAADLIFAQNNPLQNNSLLEVSLTPFEKEIFSADELNSIQIIKTALEFSLCDTELQTAKEILIQYENLEKEVLTFFAENNFSDEQKGEYILQKIHSSVLKKYQINSTLLDDTFINGNYNCVTASILYFAVAKAAGLSVSGFETPVHAYCSVFAGGKEIQVETTNPFGFAPGTKKIIEKTENSQKYTYVPKKYYSSSRKVSEKAFASLTGKNLASLMNDKNDYQNAIPLAVKRYYFLEGDSEQKTARSDLDVLLSNYAVMLSRQKKYETSLGFLIDAKEKFTFTQNLQKSYDNTFYNLIAETLNEGNDEKVLAFFEKYQIHSSQKNSAYLKNLINTQITKKKESLYHNKVVPLFNSQKYSEAREVLLEALKELPDSSLLKKDLSLVERVLQNR